MVSNADVIRTADPIADPVEIRTLDELAPASRRSRGAVQGADTLVEYGVFRVDDGVRVAGATEEDVRTALGLGIPRSRREDPDAVELVEPAAKSAAEV